jgi:hypothetical protein
MRWLPANALAPTPPPNAGLVTLTLDYSSDACMDIFAEQLTDIFPEQ